MSFGIKIKECKSIFWKRKKKKKKERKKEPKLIDELESDVYVLIHYFLQWCDFNGLNVNTEKTNLMIINCSLLPNPTVLLGNIVLNEVSKFKHLGFVLDNELKMSDHLCELKTKLSKAIFVLNYFVKFCDVKLLLSLYYSFFYSHINYCITVWGTCNKNQLDEIFKLQKKALRTMFKKRKRDSCSDLFTDNKILTTPSL